MAIDEELAARMRHRLEGLEGVSEKTMFGGLCFLVNGHMVGAASRSKVGKGRFLFRVGRNNADAAARLGQPQPMIHGGRKMTGFLLSRCRRLSGYRLRRVGLAGAGKRIFIAAKGIDSVPPSALLYSMVALIILAFKRHQMHRQSFCRS